MTRLIAVDSEEFVRAWQTSESVHFGPKLRQHHATMD